MKKVPYSVEHSTFNCISCLRKYNADKRIKKCRLGSMYAPKSEKDINCVNYKGVMRKKR